MLIRRFCGQAWGCLSSLHSRGQGRVVPRMQKVEQLMTVSTRDAIRGFGSSPLYLVYLPAIALSTKSRPGDDAKESLCDVDFKTKSFRDGERLPDSRGLCIWSLQILLESIKSSKTTGLESTFLHLLGALCKSWRNWVGRNLITPRRPSRQ